MADLNIRLTMKDRGVLSDDIRRRTAIFEAQVNGARQRGALVATEVSRSSFRRRRDISPPRRGRPNNGRMKSFIRWRPIGTGAGVGLALKELDAQAPYWIIQEIGTGQSGIQRVAGKPNPRGRPAKGARYVKTVRSQVGRKISPGLVFATPGGQYFPPGSSRSQALVPRALVKGAPVRFNRNTGRSAAGIRISREIQGQHFIKKGGKEGFREYQSSVLAAARTQFRKAAR